MKKVVLLAVFAVLVFSGVSFAKGKGGDCGCFEGEKQMHKGFMSEIKSPERKQFLKDSISIRQEMMQKRFEMEKEMLSDNPDKAKIDQLKKDMSALREKIKTARNNANIDKKDKSSN